MSEIISLKDVEYVERLARLALTTEERAKFQGQLERILGHISKLKEKNTDHVPPTAHPLEIANIWREDIPQPFENVPALFKNAPEMEETFYRVKKVME